MFETENISILTGPNIFLVFSQLNLLNKLSWIFFRKLVLKSLDPSAIFMCLPIGNLK